ncbi:uncharacterized protein LOC132713077 [Ruditapes philippinarum]|uniref:uncharacterized protein LOC132713077 n=1 Tax=Ruditapes philippinarum TaxID=129788 RepID=UPI00295A6FF1|nr:uncharacterized protein LOC132713077 [Ruditapes philippinarum]
MEVKNVRCCDTAALVALINMLKVNLSSTPEIYNTLLAVLCDFDPCKLGSRDRTVRYIRLLITDKVLANCLLMSLPQASEELQNLPFYTGSLPDMRRALKQKFQGMKVSVQSPKRRSEEPSSVPADALNQNITVIVTDQDQTKLITVDETNDPNKVRTELDPCSPFHGRNKKTTATIIPSSQPKPVITFTKSSLASSSQDTLAMMNLSNPVINNVTNQPPVTLILDAQSQSSAAKVSKNASQSRLDDLVALVKSRSNSKHATVQECVTTSAEVPVTNVCPRPVYYAGSDMNYSLLWGQREQPFSQNCKQNTNPISQARLQTPLVPLLYQPYTYPVQGSASYQSCLAGYAANSLLPWTPLTYFQGYTPNPHYPTAPLHFGQLSSTSGIDATLDLSLKKKPESQTQSRHSDNNGNSNENNKKKTSQKRSASVSTVPNENEILQPKQKVRKTSTETPERSMSPYIKETAKCQPALNKTASYLSSGDDRKSIDERPNSLKALQELTLRIDGNMEIWESVQHKVKISCLQGGSCQLEV